MRVIQATIEYSFGDIVFLKTDPEALPRVVVEWLLTPGTLIKYGLKVGDCPVTHHIGLEITTELTEVESLFKEDA